MGSVRNFCSPSVSPTGSLSGGVAAPSSYTGSGGLSLPAKTNDGFGGHAQAGAKNLQCHLAAKGHLAGFVDNPHPSATDLATDLEVAQLPPPL